MPFLSNRLVSAPQIQNPCNAEILIPHKDILIDYCFYIVILIAAAAYCVLL